jgi:type II secretory pathway pseudopilin PulG
MMMSEMKRRMRKAVNKLRYEPPSVPPEISRGIERFSEGFSLIEVIATILVTAILGVIFINFMGTAMSRSARAVLNVEAEAKAQALMERIVAEYAVEINKDNPSDALTTIKSQDHGSTVTKKFIAFDSNGEVSIERDSPPTDTLKITIVWDTPDAPSSGGTALTSLLTNSRRSSGTPPVAF